jgi:hypothetical protein
LIMRDLRHEWHQAEDMYSTPRAAVARHEFHELTRIWAEPGRCFDSPWSHQPRKRPRALPPLLWRRGLGRGGRFCQVVNSC